MRPSAVRAGPLAALVIPLTAMFVGTPVANADIASDCASKGGQYSSQTVRFHWSDPETFNETCCTGEGASKECITYANGVQVSVYKGS
jgi:hypothetical protein